jgi:hypothetical protein
MSQKDLLQNQVIEEILREKAGHYNARNRMPDFWVLINPSFLKENNLLNNIRNTNFYSQQKEKINYKFKDSNEFKEFYGVLISTNEEFMRWIKLRLGYFENINEFNKNNTNQFSYISDGVFGIINNQNFKNILQSQTNFLHPDILINKFKNSLELYY